MGQHADRTKRGRLFGMGGGFARDAQRVIGEGDQIGGGVGQFAAKRLRQVQQAEEAPLHPRVEQA